MDYATRHKGIITDIAVDSRTVTVRLSDDAADCGGCALRGICSPSGGDSGDTVTVTASVGASCPSIGDTVVIGLPDKARWFSSIVILVVPVVLFVATLLIALATGTSQATAALAAIIATALYFALLIPLRHRLDRHVRWQLTDT